MAVYKVQIGPHWHATWRGNAYLLHRQCRKLERNAHKIVFPNLEEVNIKGVKVKVKFTLEKATKALSEGEEI